MSKFTAIFGSDAITVLEDVNFQLLLFANVVGVLGTALVSPLLSSLVDPFGATPSTIGLMISVFTAPGVLFIPIAGSLADRFGRKSVIVGGLVVYGVSGGAISLTTDFQVVLGLRLLQGIGYAAIVPVVITMLGDLYAGTEEAAAQGLRFSTSGLSLTVFPLVAVALMVFGWAYPFLLFLSAIPAAVMVWMYLEEPTEVTGDSSNEEAGRPSPTRGATRERGLYAEQLLQLVCRAELLSIIVARSLAAVVLIGFLTYVSIIIVELGGGTPQQAGIAVAVNSLVFAAAASQVGKLSTRFRLAVPLAGGTVCLGLGMVIVSISSSFWLLLTGAALLGIGVGVSLTIHRSIVTAYAPDAYRGAIVSFSESAGRLATSITPVGMGLAIAAATPALGFDGAIRWTGISVGALGLVGGFICLAVWSRVSDESTGSANHVCQPGEPGE